MKKYAGLNDQIKEHLLIFMEKYIYEEEGGKDSDILVRLNSVKKVIENGDILHIRIAANELFKDGNMALPIPNQVDAFARLLIGIYHVPYGPRGEVFLANLNIVQAVVNYFSVNYSRTETSIQLILVLTYMKEAAARLYLQKRNLGEKLNKAKETVNEEMQGQYGMCLKVERNLTA